MKTHAMTLAALLVVPAAAIAEAPATSAQKTIVETAVSAGQFNTLVAAVKAAGLAETLSDNGPFTVFAPTDAAFAKLPKGTIDTLLKPENKEKLASILKYHFVKGKVPASKVTQSDSLESLQGNDLTIGQQAGAVMVDNARVVKTDIMCSNGIIHVIDAVVLPKQ